MQAQLTGVPLTWEAHANVLDRLSTCQCAQGSPAVIILGNRALYITPGMAEQAGTAPVATPRLPGCQVPLTVPRPSWYTTENATSAAAPSCSMASIADEILQETENFCYRRFVLNHMRMVT